MDRDAGCQTNLQKSSNTANPLYAKLSPTLPDRFSTAAISKKLYYYVKYLDSPIPKKIKIPQCGILIAKYVGK
jgi:hypothetical protein